MITKRDKKILRWIEHFGSITINQCSKVFFTNNKQGYDQARKRLKYLYNEDLLRRYRKDPKSEAIYYMEKRLKPHDLKLMDVVSEFYAQGWEIHQFDKEFTIMTGDYKKYIVDGRAVFRKGEIYLPVILEIDYSHMTGVAKIKDIISTFKNNKYKKLFLVVRITEEKMKTKDSENPDVEIIYLPWNLDGLNKLLCPVVR